MGRGQGRRCSLTRKACGGGAGRLGVEGACSKGPRRGAGVGGGGGGGHQSQGGGCYQVYQKQWAEKDNNENTN